MNYQVLDVAMLERKLSHQGLRQQLLKEYLHHAGADLEQLSEHYQNKQSDQIKSLLITLQGTANLVSAKPLEQALAAFKVTPNTQTWSDVATLQQRLMIEIEAYLTQ